MSAQRKCKYCGPSVCRPCTVYVVADRDGCGFVKVGVSFSPTRRLAQHRKKTGRDLAVFFKFETSCEYLAMDVESAALDALMASRVQGDWHSCTVEDAIVAVKAAGGRNGC